MSDEFVGKLDYDEDYDPDAESQPQWSPFNPDGTLRDLAAEGWTVMGALKDEDL